MNTYLLIDLENQRTEKGTLTGGLRELTELPLWQEDRSLVALASGILTGSGAPGTGTMLWIYQKDGADKMTIEMQQGAMSSVLRCGGTDYLLLKGKGSDAYVQIEEGEVSFLKKEITDRRKIKISLDEDCVKEDDYFTIGARGIKDCLKEKGIRGIYGESRKGMMIADAGTFLEQCIKLAKEYYEDIDEVEEKVPYLSVTKGFQADMLAAYLGVAWDGRTDTVKAAKQLIRAFTGDTVNLEKEAVLNAEVEGGQDA